MSETATEGTPPKLKLQMLSDREVDEIEGYQTKIRALRDRYLSFELALEEARKELDAVKASVLQARAQAEADVKAVLAPTEERKAALEQEIERLNGRVLSLRVDGERMQKSVENQQEADQTRARELDGREQTLNGSAHEVERQRQAVVAKEQALTQREGELVRLGEHLEQVQAHTSEIEARVAQQQAQLDRTLEEIKNNRVAEVQARQEAETARRQMEEAKAALLVSEREHAEVKRNFQAAEAKYREAVELHDQALVLDQTNKVKEIALRDVEARLTRDKYQLRQAQSKFLEEVEAHRKQCEDCAAKAAAQPGGTVNG